MPAPPPNVAELVAQMPDTDKELQAKRDQAGPPSPPGAPEPPKPKPDGFGAASKFTGPDPASAEKIFEAILSGGRDSLLELLRLVREPGDADYKNYKAAYVLHGLVLLAGRAGREEARRLVAQTLAAQLGSDQYSKAVRGLFIRELRVIGGPEAVDALGRQLLEDDLGGDAAQALLSIGDGVASQFRSALDKSKGRHRITILQALGVLQDTGSAAAFKQALTDADREVRRTGAWALANIGDASATAALLQSADGATGWERAEATKVCLLLAERLTATGKKLEAARIYTHLRETRTDPKERHIREAAERALSGPAQ